MSTDQPWAPFPVQDWSTMPYDPLAPARPATPAPRQRPWWPPLIVFILIGALIGGLAYAGTSVGYADPRSAAAAFLPADGDVAYAREETTGASGTTTAATVTESAIVTGVSAYLSADTAFGAAAFASVTDYKSLRLWRTTSTPTSSASAVQTSRVYQVNDAVVLLGESLPTAGYAYSPGLVELPARVAAGQAWTSAGSAGAVLDYRSELRATADGDDCLRVTGDITYKTRNGDSSWTAAVERRWCRGAGIVAQTSTIGDTRSAVTRVEQPAVVTLPPTTVDRRIAWTNPTSWQAHDFTVRSINPAFGEAPMTGSVAPALAPVPTASGLVVRAMSSPDDLVALTPRTSAVWGTVWRVHPGGSIVSLTGFGDVVLVTTSLRRLVAYSADGVRLWQRQLTEIAPTEPVRVSATRAVLVDLSGTVVTFELATGAVVWSRGVGSDVSRTPVAGDGVVVIMDRGGTVHALDAGSGAPRWTADLEGVSGVASGRLVVIVQDQTTRALDASTGRTVWLRPFLGTLTGMAALGDTVVVATQSGTQLVDAATGDIVGRAEPSYRLTAVDDQLVSWGAAEAELISVDGVILHRWPTAKTTVVSASRLAVATPEGPQLHTGDWPFTQWSA